ncbi:hypothetical protein [Lentzea aerocolonigenes]|uniref:hypothetical protein n=1 Tax=Lentzea aerocolonigenes TaxID=68170 RepID=UPI0012DDC764|nr:hypothetical protein [Lentzea aerocolonigenes]
MYATKREKDLERELRDIVRVGSALDKVCDSLVVFKSLTNVLKVSEVNPRKGLDFYGKKLVSVYTLRTALQRAIQRIPHCGTTGEPDLRRPYAEVLALLFGATERTRTESVERRWELARLHYNETVRMHVPGHATNIAKGHFRRKIYEEELLPLLVESLLDWEERPGQTYAEELFRTDYTEPAADMIYWKWKNRFFWLFKLDGLLVPVIRFMTEYLKQRDDLRKKNVQLPPRRIASKCQACQDDALLTTAMVWQLIHADVFSSVHLQQAQQAIAWFKQTFPFPAEDADVVYGLAVEKESGSRSASLGSFVTSPFDGLDVNQYASLMENRFFHFSEACKCGTPEGIGVPCPIHNLIAAASELHDTVSAEWVKMSAELAVLPMRWINLSSDDILHG